METFRTVSDVRLSAVTPAPSDAKTPKTKFEFMNLPLFTYKPSHNPLGSQQYSERYSSSFPYPLGSWQYSERYSSSFPYPLGSRQYSERYSSSFPHLLGSRSPPFPLWEQLRVKQVWRTNELGEITAISADCFYSGCLQAKQVAQSKDLLTEVSHKRVKNMRKVFCRDFATVRLGQNFTCKMFQ